MEEMNPRIRIRLGHPKELPLHFLDGILFQVGQDEEQLVGRRGERTGVIRRVAPARAGLPINGTVLHINYKRLLEMGQQHLKFCFRQAGHRS
jgi:hypothetical protein